MTNRSMKKIFQLIIILTISAPTALMADDAPIRVCVDSSITLTPDSANHKHTWSTGDTTTSITVTPTQPGTYTYSCETYRYEILTTNNLMANGDFENYSDYHQKPAGFTSDYQYLAFDPYGTNLYETYSGYSGVYLLSNNANHTWRDYANVSPHGGNYFAMFDAAQSGFAWRVTTNDNPNMVLQENGLYIFSYWAADLNKEDQRQHPAGLQFSINYKDDATGQMNKEYLGTVLSLGKDNKWHYSETFWTAPCNSSYIEIGVEDTCNYRGVGNDFGLDDIIFQMITREITVPVDEQQFTLTVEDCRPCQGFVYRKWDDVLFADNADSLYVAYQWYHDGVEMTGETRQFIYRPTDHAEGIYYCVATRHDGVKDQSCEFTFDETPRSVQSTHRPQQAPAIKYLRNSQLVIRHQDCEYNSYGIRIK